MQEFFHSVTLDRDKCQGCINCIKRCPTEAIRVRNKKATIIAERCIDCGECIRVCPPPRQKGGDRQPGRLKGLRIYDCPAGAVVYGAV